MIEIKNIQGKTITRIDGDYMWNMYIHDTDLSNADFRDSRIAFARIVNCNLTGADFRGADLSKARIEKCNFNDAIIDRFTKLPKRDSKDYGFC